jgi:hypothetical protein
MSSATNTINLGPRARRVVRLVARLVNPIVLLIAGRRWMPVVGILHHRGRRSGRAYATPIGLRPLGDGFVIPRTFSETPPGITTRRRPAARSSHTWVATTG